MNVFKPQLENLEIRANPDGPKPIDPLTGFPFEITPVVIMQPAMISAMNAVIQVGIFANNDTRNP